MGKPNLLVGAEGIGKSLWTVHAIAAVTTGKPWGPFTIAAPSADVVLIATEDGWPDTIRPRLEAAGADLERVHMLCSEADGTGPATSADLHVLRGSDIRPVLVVADAWVDTVPGGLNIKDSQQCREAIKPWKDYAADVAAAVLLVTHTNRLASGSPRDTYGLSAALRQVARSTLYALEDPDTGALLVGPEKSNLSGAAVAQRFQRASVQKFDATIDSDGTVPCLEYLGADDLTIREIVAAQHGASQQGSKASKNDEVDQFLRDALECGRMASDELNELGEMLHGFSKDQISRGRHRLGIKAYKADGRWFAELKTSETA
jgi:hypothetical protein